MTTEPLPLPRASSTVDFAVPVSEPVVTGRSQAAFGAFYRATWPDLARYCVALVRDPAVAEEITQEALTRVFARFPVLRDPRPYAYRVALHLAADHWRHARRTQPVPTMLPYDEPVADSDGSVLAAVRALPAPLRDVVLLHYYADLRIEDVARVVRRPAGTVKRRLYEARALLAVEFGEIA